MPYCFERNESVTVAVRRIIGELTWMTTNELHPGHPNYQSWVHNTRTCYKKIRSLLRLVRNDLGTAYQDEQSRLRNAANILSRLRDAEVLVQTCDLLAGYYAEAASPDSFVDLRNAFIARHQRVTQVESNLPQKQLYTANQLADLPVRCADWTISTPGFADLTGAFARSYRRGQQGLRKAMERPSNEAFHEWRKRVKDHWYHCRLFDPAWPPAMMWRIAELKDLSDVLGEDHDLAVLQQVLADESETIALDGSFLLELAARRQQELRQRAAELGRSVYAVAPEDLQSRLCESLERWL